MGLPAARFGLESSFLSSGNQTSNPPSPPTPSRGSSVLVSETTAGYRHVLCVLLVHRCGIYMCLYVWRPCGVPIHILWDSGQCLCWPQRALVSGPTRPAHRAAMLPMPGGVGCVSLSGSPSVGPSQGFGQPGPALLSLPPSFPARQAGVGAAWRACLWLRPRCRRCSPCSWPHAPPTSWADRKIPDIVVQRWLQAGRQQGVGATNGSLSHQHMVRPLFQAGPAAYIYMRVHVCAGTPLGLASLALLALDRKYIWCGAGEGQREPASMPSTFSSPGTT